MKNTERLGEVLSREMRRTIRANEKTTLDFGTIESGSSLVTDRLRESIPAGSYSLLRRIPPEGEVTDTPQVVKGDRVLVVWVGNEPVVIGKIT